MKKNFVNILENAVAGHDAHEETIRQRIIIRDDFKALIPPLNDEELSQLESNVLAEGIRDPLVIWPSGGYYVLIDGHNRFSLCQKHKLSFPFAQITFSDEEEARDWMIRNQLGRRNLSKEQLSYLRGLRYNREKSQGRRTDLTTLDHNDLPKNESTAAILACKIYNVSEATIKRDADFAAGVELIGTEDLKLKQEILNGKSTLSKKEIAAKAKEPSRGPNRSSVETSAKSLSSNQIIEIAFKYIQSETRSFDEVCQQLAEDPATIAPKEFFVRWNSTK